MFRLCSEQSTGRTSKLDHVHVRPHAIPQRRMRDKELPLRVVGDVKVADRNPSIDPIAVLVDERL